MGKTKTKQTALAGAKNCLIWLEKFDAKVRKNEKYDDLLEHGVDLEAVWLQRRVKQYDAILAKRDQMKLGLLQHGMHPALADIDDAGHHGTESDMSDVDGPDSISPSSEHAPQTQ